MDTDHLVSRLLAAYNEHDTAAAAALYADDARHVEMSSGRSQQGPGVIAAGLGYLLRSFPDAVWAVRDVIGDDDRTAVRYTLTGSLQADFGPYPARGQQLCLPGVLVVHQDGDRIDHAEDYWDAATFARQMAATGPGA
jgi:steroid delta-isomerase-like uncharacterized protein